MASNPQRLTVKTFTVGPRSVILSQASDLDLSDVAEDGLLKYNLESNSFTVQTLPLTVAGTSTAGYVPGLGGSAPVNAATVQQLVNIEDGLSQALVDHEADLSNPHSVTKAQVGLGSVLNVDTTTTFNIVDSLNKRFVTDAQRTRLTSISALSSPGFISQLNDNTYVNRVLVGPANGISVANGSGVAGNPTLSLTNDLAAVEGLSTTGVAVRSANDTWVTRTITGTANQITVSNGDGVSGNPTISLPSNLVLNTVNASSVVTPSITTPLDTDLVISSNGSNITVENPAGEFTTNSSSATLIVADDFYLTSTGGSLEINALNSYLFSQYALNIESAEGVIGISAFDGVSINGGDTGVNLMGQVNMPDAGLEFRFGAIRSTGTTVTVTDRFRVGFPAGGDNYITIDGADATVGPLIETPEFGLTVRSPQWIDLDTPEVRVSGLPLTTAGTINSARLPSTSVTAGSYGSASQTLTATVDAKGRLTALAAVTSTPAFASITGKPNTITGYGIIDGARELISVQEATNGSTHIYLGRADPSTTFDQPVTDVTIVNSSSEDLVLQTVSDSATVVAGQTVSFDVYDDQGQLYFSINSSNKLLSSISLTGDITGTGGATIDTTLSNTGVSAGTYRSVTVNTKGRVTAGTNPTTLAGYGIADGQPLDSDLTALAGNTTAGLWASTAIGSGAARTLTAPAAGFTITNPAGTAGNPTFALSNDLAAVEALSTTGISVRTATDTWTTRTITGTAGQITVVNGDGVSGAPTLSLPSTTVTAGSYGSASQTLTATVDAQGRLTALAAVTSAPAFASVTGKPTTLAGYGIADGQPLDSDLTALAGNTTAGLWASTAIGSGAARTLAAPAAGFTITNPAGTAGNPTFTLSNDLAAVEGLSTNGMAVRTGTDAWAVRTITGTAGQITVTNGDGVAGAPTISLPASITQATTFTAATIVSNATASTTKTTGALQVTGGVGIGGSVVANLVGASSTGGLSVGIDRAIMLDGANGTIQHSHPAGTGLTIVSSTACSLVLIPHGFGGSTYAQLHLGGTGRTRYGITSTLPIDFFPQGVGGASLILSSTSTAVASPTASTSSTTGALTVAGGAGIAGVLSTGAAQNVKINVLTANTTLDATHHYIVCNSATAFTVTMPAASANSGRIYHIKNKNAGLITVDATALGLIDWLNTTTLPQWSSIAVLSDGATWNIL